MLAAAQARIAAAPPAAYARTRNARDGAVTGLSPYITHGLFTLADVLAGVTVHHTLDLQHKFVFELGWRAYFGHLWQHRGDGILRSLHQGLLPDEGAGIVTEPVHHPQPLTVHYDGACACAMPRLCFLIGHPARVRLFCEALWQPG